MIKDSMILTFSKGIRGVLMLVLNMIIARMFSETMYGTYKQIMLISTLFTTICILGIPTTISYYYVKYDKENRNRLFGNTLLVLGSISVIAAASVVFFREYIVKFFNNPNIVNLVTILAAYIFIMILSSALENFYISSDNTVLLGKIYIIYTVIYFISLLSILLLFKDIYLLILTMFVIEFIRTIFMIYLIIVKEKLNIKCDFYLLKKQLLFALPLGGVGLVQSINSYIDNLFVSNNYTPDKYAAFANAATDIPLVSIVTISVAAVILPKMSKSYSDNMDSEDILNIWGESCKKTGMIMFPIFWILLMFSSGYIEIIFSEKYILDSTPIFIIYLLKFPLYCTVFGNILIVIGKQKYVMYNSLIGVILNVILNQIFIKIFGMKGPAIATVIVQYIVVFLLLNKIGKSTNTDFKRIMPFKELLSIFLVPGIISVPLFVISSVFHIPNYIGIIIFGVIIYGISFVFYYKMKYFNYLSIIKNVR